MKKMLCLLLSLISIISLFTLTSHAVSGTTYYVDSVNGNDANSGTDISSPFKTFSGFSKVDGFYPGDSILFKNGGIYECAAEITCSGTKSSPVTISSYGEGETATLYTNEKTEVLRIIDCSYLTVSDLRITAPNGGGIWIDTVNKTSEGITLSNLYFYDMQNYKVTSRDNLGLGASVARAAVMVKGLPSRSRYAVNDLTITDCEVYDCANGFSIWGSWNDQQNPGCAKEDIDPVFNKNVLVKNCCFREMDAEAIIVGICDGALVTNCRAINCCQGEGVDESGEPIYYTAAMWFWGSVNSTIEYCEIAGQKNVGDGMSVDFDSYSHNCTYQYIYSHDNTRFMRNCPTHDGQRGNTVRYCLSVNDNRGEATIAGNAGEHGLKFYNNTIVNCGDFNINSMYSALFANNIIVPMKGHAITYDSRAFGANNIFASNCYYNTINPVVDITSVNTVPGFEKESFTLSKDSPLIGAGIEVEGAPEYDFFGNKITSRNIGCYGGDGIDCEYTGENFFQKIVRIIRNIFEIIRHEITEIIDSSK